jgi:hypothetical protein
VSPQLAPELGPILSGSGWHHLCLWELPELGKPDVRDTCCRSLSCFPGDCVEEIVTNSNLSSITFQSCTIQGQIGIAKWMSEHPIYHANWTLQRYKCAPGHYELHVKA